MGVERALVGLVWRFLAWRGWVVWLNPPELCEDIHKADDGRRYDRGWWPVFSIRYGHTPVYRGPGQVRTPLVNRSQVAVAHKRPKLTEADF